LKLPGRRAADISGGFRTACGGAPTLLQGFRFKPRFDSRMSRVLFAWRIELPIGLADFTLS
jgi:hypothetical protein